MGDPQDDLKTLAALLNLQQDLLMDFQPIAPPAQIRAFLRKGSTEQLQGALVELLDQLRRRAKK